jgi:hypothetical protein
MAGAYRPATDRTASGWDGSRGGDAVWVQPVLSALGSRLACPWPGSDTPLPIGGQAMHNARYGFTSGLLGARLADPGYGPLQTGEVVADGTGGARCAGTRCTPATSW